MPLSPAVALSFIGLTVAMAVMFAVGLSRAGQAQRGYWLMVGLGIAVNFLAVSAVLALTGVLGNVDARPPPAGLMLLGMSVGVVALGMSRVGDRLLRLPLAVLVGFQSFRIGVEVILAAAHGDGSVPVEMTYHGFNFDIVSGLTALALGVWLWRGRPPRAVVWGWNVSGLMLLAGAVVIAALSAFGILPTDPQMTLPISFPGVWLPAWLVQLALLGHVLVFRKLRQPYPARLGAEAERASAPAPALGTGLGQPRH